MKSMKGNSQSKYLNTKFSFDQYWSIYYTEVFPDKTEKDFRVIIKARSANFAKKILKDKVKEDNNSTTKSLCISMISAQSKINRIKVNLEDWEHIRTCAFPNLADHLFKFFVPRPKGNITRFHTHIPKNGNKFKKGNPSRKINLTLEEKAYMKFEGGKYVSWPPRERNALKDKIILSLKGNKNNRTHAAKELGISPKCLHRLMSEKFIEVDWRKDYPPPKMGFGYLDSAKLEELQKKGWKKRQEKYYESIFREIIKLHNEGFSVNKIHTKLGHARSTIKKIIEKYGSKTKEHSSPS